MAARVAGAPGTTLLPVPEPDLTPREMIRRAQSFRQLLRDQQEEAERLGPWQPGPRRREARGSRHAVVGRQPG